MELPRGTPVSSGRGWAELVPQAAKGANLDFLAKAYQDVGQTPPPQSGPKC